MKRVIMGIILIVTMFTFVGCGSESLEDFAEIHAPEAVARLMDDIDGEATITAMHWFSMNYEAQADERFIDARAVMYYVEVIINGEETVVHIDYAIGEDERGDQEEWDISYSGPFTMFEDFDVMRAALIEMMTDKEALELDSVDMEYDYGTYSEAQINAWLNE